MRAHLHKIGRHSAIVFLETAAVLILLLAIVTAGLVSRLSQGPIGIGFAKDYVEEALSDKENEISVKFDDIVFSWPNLQGPFQLDLKGLTVRKGKEDSNTLSISDASIGLSRASLLFGLIRPISVIINAPSLELVRATDGTLSLFVQEKEVLHKEEEKTQSSDPGQQVAQIFKDMASKKGNNMISRLNRFVIHNASVAVRDHQFGISWYLTDLDFSIEKRPQGVGATLAVALPGGRAQNANITMDMVYRKDTDDFRAAAKIQNVNPYIISRFLPVPDILGGQDLYFSGNVESTMDTNLVPSQVKFSGAIPEGQVVVPEEFDAPIGLKNIAIESDYKGSDKVLNISKLAGEINGIAFSGEGRGTFAEKSITMPIELTVASVPLAQIPPLFPKSEHDGEAYHWLAHEMEGGTFSKVSLKMELAAEKTRNEELQRDEWDVKTPQLKLGFAFEGMKVTYSPTLMPAEEAKGTGLLDLGAQTLDIKGEHAKIGDIISDDISIKVSELLTAGAGYVEVKAKTKGPMASALNYIAAAPINMGKDQIGIDPATVKGTIAADVEVGLPTIKDVPKDQVKVTINGTLTDLDIPKIVEGLSLSGGPLTLATEEGGFRIKGQAKLEGRDTTLDWHQYFVSAGHPYSMQVQASIGADQELRNHFGVNLDEYITGTMPVDVVYTRQVNGDSKVDVKGDLTPVRIYIDPFKFEKPVGTAGSVVLTANLEKDVLKTITGLEVKGKSFALTGANLDFAAQNGKKADLAKGKISSAVIGNTSVAVDFTVSDKNVMTVNAKGAVFDLGPFLQETESSDLNVKAQKSDEVSKVQAPKQKQQQAMKIALSADRMLGKNDQAAKNAKVYMEMDDDGDITRMEMDAAIGQGMFLIRFRPDETGKRTFRLETNDAGSVLYTFGLYENIHGGTLLVYAEPKGGDLRGDLFGVARMENFRVVKAPALASLLSLMSLTGVSQLLSNQGLVFSKLESPFEWRFRPAGNLLIIKDGKTSGSSIGLTFSGVVDRGKKTTDITGTIIPMTEVNSLLAKIPLLGDILGGSTGLIAATYTMKGPSSDPSVMVNPLSVLAPGFLRRILFEGGYESRIPDDEKEAEAAKAKAKANVVKPTGNPRTQSTATKPATNNLTVNKAKTN